jgi:hypothetical protein
MSQGELGRVSQEGGALDVESSVGSGHCGGHSHVLLPSEASETATVSVSILDVGKLRLRGL